MGCFDRSTTVRLRVRGDRVIVGVVLITFNSASVLRDSLLCVKALAPHQIVVVDNASEDDSARVAVNGGADVERSEQNLGFGRAVNCAVSRLEQDVDLILLLNPDCIISPQEFEKLVAALSHDPRLGAVSPSMRYPSGQFGIAGGAEPTVLKEWIGALGIDRLISERARHWLGRRRWKWIDRGMLSYLRTEPSGGTSRVAWVSGYCMLVRRSAFDSVGGFDGDFFLYFEDIDLCTRMRRAGWTVALVRDSVATHIESTSTRAVGKNRLYRQGMDMYFSKHGGKASRFWSGLLRSMPI
jgi:N-acetylglucosaminyl-diphospho-decaprenol L-rhamnosyltransferase